MSLKNVITNKLSNILINKPLKSYSQSGEDLIVAFILNALGITKPFYLDIGAHHSKYLNNTFYFYKKKSKGICIEPDKKLFDEIKKNRKRDICLNVGVSSKNQNAAPFYVMSKKTMNTFSKEEADFLNKNTNQRIKNIVSLPLIAINDLLTKYYNNKVNYVSLDTEGFDYEIISSFDFSKFSPEVFCIETLSYSENNDEAKDKKIIEHMIENGYFIYADTYINTIFVNKKSWLNR